MEEEQEEFEETEERELSRDDVTDCHVRLHSRPRPRPPVGYAIPEQILDERMFKGEYYKITWCDRNESCDSWELASRYDGGVDGGAWVKLVHDCEE